MKITPDLFGAYQCTVQALLQNHLVLGLASGSASHAELPQVLDARDLVASGAVVFSDLRLNDDLRIEFVGYDEIRRLIKARDPFRPLRLSEANAITRQNPFDGGFKIVADEFAHGVAMPCERTPKKSFVQEHRIRDSDAGHRANSLQPFGCSLGKRPGR